MFRYVLLNECPTFIFHDCIFGGRIALPSISYASKMFVAKMHTAKAPHMLWHIDVMLKCFPSLAGDRWRPDVMRPHDGNSRVGGPSWFQRPFPSAGQESHVMPGHSGRTYYSDDDEGSLADLPSAGGHGQRSPLSLFLPTLYLTPGLRSGSST